MMRDLVKSSLLSICLGSLVASASAQETETPREGGLTGTGIVALVGNYSTLEINGLSIAYPVDLTMSSTLEDDAVTGSLQPGDTVAALVIHDDQGWIVSEIIQILPLVGPVSDQTETTLTIMGTLVIQPDLESAITVGEWVAVSGFWREDKVVATRLEVIAPQTFAQIQGTYYPEGSSDGQIGGSHIYDAAQIDMPTSGVIRVFGQETKDGILAQSFQAAPFETPVRTVLTQGYLSVPDTEGFYTVLGAGLISQTQRPEMIDPQAFVTFCGVDGNLLVPDLKIEDAQDVKVLSKLSCFP